MVLRVEIQIDRGASAIEMAQTILGDGVPVISASYTGDQDSSGIYTNGDTIAPGGEAVEFVFSSEEYPEYATGAFLDFVGAWINGNLVRLGMGEGDTGVFNFTYDVQSSTGETDVGIVTVDSLRGDLVMTQDDGPQPLCWIGQRGMAVQGEFAPIWIAANTFGSHHELPLSPLHRALIRDRRAELLSDESEGLVSARGAVENVHILCDCHPVVVAEGPAIASFLPGPRINHSIEADIMQETCIPFPEIAPETGQGHSGAARRTLKRYEARLLMSQGRAA